MMRITISREIEKNDFSKVAEVYDSFYLAMMMEALVEEAYKSGNANFQVTVDFPTPTKGDKA
jgi:negative regulator of genetic competence, sporulation and motility